MYVCQYLWMGCQRGWRKSGTPCRQRSDFILFKFTILGYISKEAQGTVSGRTWHFKSGKNNQKLLPRRPDDEVKDGPWQVKGGSGASRNVVLNDGLQFPKANQRVGSVGPGFQSSSS